MKTEAEIKLTKAIDEAVTDFLKSGNFSSKFEFMSVVANRLMFEFCKRNISTGMDVTFAKKAADVHITAFCERHAPKGYGPFGRKLEGAEFIKEYYSDAAH